jgi:hypothetical protein
VVAYAIAHAAKPMNRQLLEVVRHRARPRIARQADIPDCPLIR